MHAIGLSQAPPLMVTAVAGDGGWCGASVGSRGAGLVATSGQRTRSISRHATSAITDGGGRCLAPLGRQEDFFDVAFLLAAEKNIITVKQLTV